jgi:hypothetical protein
VRPAERKKKGPPDRGSCRPYHVPTTRRPAEKGARGMPSPDELDRKGQNRLNQSLWWSAEPIGDRMVRNLESESRLRSSRDGHRTAHCGRVQLLIVPGRMYEKSCAAGNNMTYAAYERTPDGHSEHRVAQNLEATTRTPSSEPAAVKSPSTPGHDRVYRAPTSEQSPRPFRARRQRVFIDPAIPTKTVEASWRAVPDQTGSFPGSRF